MLTRAIDPGEIFRVLNKWKRLILALLILGPLLGLGASMLMTKRFEAVAQIKIDKEDPVAVPGADTARTVMLRGTEYMATQVGLLQSRALAQRVVDAQRLANNPDFVDQSGSAAQRRDAAAERLRKQVAIEIVRDSRLVNITIVGDNAAQTATLANAYADQFIASNLEREFEKGAYSRKFLEDRLNSTREKLEKSERDIVAYATQQGIVEVGGSDEGGGQTSLEAASLLEINTALAEARNQRIAAEQKYRHSSGRTPSDNAVLLSLTQRRAEAQAEYQAKSVVFLPGYPELVALRRQIEVYDREIAQQRSDQGTSVRQEYQAAVARERELQGRLDALKGKVLDLKKRSIQYTILQREVDTSRALYDALLQKYKEVGLTDGVADNKVSIVDRAKPPSAPVAPNVPMNVLLGLIAGLLLGIGGAFLIEFIDDTIKLPDDVESKLHMTLLGVLPQTDEEEDYAEILKDPKSELVEAALSLRTALQFATSHGIPKVLLVTSSRPGEGKSSVSLALAASLAKQGKSTLLIDADMRKPTFYSGTTSRTDSVGLSNILAGEVEFDKATHKSEFANLSIIMAGPTVPNPAALLSEEGFAELLAGAAARFDHVVIDGPPVMGLADAPIMGSLSEAVLMVVEASSVSRSMIRAALGRLRASNSRVLGIVLNKYESKKNGYGYSYSYSYHYADNDDERRKLAIVK